MSEEPSLEFQVANLLKYEVDDDIILGLLKRYMHYTEADIFLENCKKNKNANYNNSMLIDKQLLLKLKEYVNIKNIFCKDNIYAYKSLYNKQCLFTINLVTGTVLLATECKIGIRIVEEYISLLFAPPEPISEF
jgi:hypothetical protein